MAFVSAKFEHKSGPPLLCDSVHGFQLNTFKYIQLKIHGLQFE